MGVSPVLHRAIQSSYVKIQYEKYFVDYHIYTDKFEEGFYIIKKVGS